MLAVRGDHVQVEFRLGIVPAEHHAQPRRSQQGIGLVELDALQRLPRFADHLHAIGAGAEGVGPDEAPGLVRI
ncbi:hypothetical protein D3C81_2075980 [compost metagenome]